MKHLVVARGAMMGWLRALVSDPASLPLWLLAVLFTASAAVAWWSGVRLTRSSQSLGARFGLTSAVTGMVLLGLASSLPAVVASVVAASTGDAPVAVNNIVGGAAFGVVLLVAADARLGKLPLTTVAHDPAALLEGLLSAMAMVLVALVVLVGDAFAWWGVGAGGLFVTAFALAGVWFTSHFHVRWDPERVPSEEHPGRKRRPKKSLKALVTIFAMAAAAAIVGGYALTRSAQGLAETTGLGHSFVGVLLVGAAGSLPTLSAVIAAVDLEAPDLAVSTAFGSNLVMVLTVLLADLFYREGAILDDLGRFPVAASLLAVLLTGVYLAGMLTRRTRRFVGLGADSWMVLVAYLAGMGLLYWIR